MAELFPVPLSSGLWGGRKWALVVVATYPTCTGEGGGGGRGRGETTESSVSSERES